MKRVGEDEASKIGVECTIRGGRVGEKPIFFIIFEKKVILLFGCYDNFISLHQKKVLKNGKLLDELK